VRHQGRARSNITQPGRQSWPVWGSYLVLAVILTWPTILQLSTHLPGDGGDDPAIAWNLWWVKYALLNTGQNPFQTDYLFYPLGVNLAFYTLTVLNAVTALPLTLNLGVVTASNLHLLFTFVVGGYGTFLLTRYVLATMGMNEDQSGRGISGPVAGRSLVWLSAAIAGGFYAFASSKLFYVALGQFNIASNHWVPLTVLYVLRTRHNPHSLKNPMLAGLFLTLQAWAEMTYASFLLVFIGLYWLYWLVLDARGFQAKQLWSVFARHLRTVTLLGITFAIGISPILARMLPDLRAEGDFLLEGGGFAETFSADLLGFIIPTMHHPVLGQLVIQTGIGDFDKGQHIYLGLVLLGLLGVSLGKGYRFPALRFWLIAALVFALLALGPVIKINGWASQLSGPFTLLQDLPFFKANRYPSRYSVMLVLSLSVIAGFSLVQIGQWFGSRSPNRVSPSKASRDSLAPIQDGQAKSYSITSYLILALISLLFLLEHLAVPLPQSDMRAPAPYHVIANDPNDVTMLDIPFAWRNGFRITGAWTTQFMFGQFYQATHQKRLLQGNTSRNPAFKFQYFTNAPILNSLLALETGKSLPQGRWEADRAIAGEVLRFFNIKYIVVRPDDTGNPTVTPQATRPYIEAVLPVEKIHDEAAIIIYRVQNLPAQTANASTQTPVESAEREALLIDSTSPLAPLYFGEGWGLLSHDQPIAAQRRDVRLLVPLGEGRQRLTLRLRLPEFYRAHQQTISLRLNGWQSPPRTVEPAWRDYVFELPTGATRSGLNDIGLHFAEVMPMPQIGDQMPLADPEVTVLSAGEEVGDFGYIYLNGHQVSPNGRGYNVVTIQPDGTGQTMVRTANFDTNFDPAASAELVRFLSETPPGSVVAVAAADEASQNLSEEAELALQGLGARGDLRACFRCSQALITQTPPGSIQPQQSLDSLRPVGLALGLGLTEPNIAALVEWIRVEGIAPK
jgi:hypothetical protein